MNGPFDPYPLYEKIRAEGPLYRDPSGPWISTSYALSNQILRSRQFGVRYSDGSLAPGSTQGSFPGSLTNEDLPNHTRLRRLAAPAFSPKKIDEYHVLIEKVTESLLRKEEFDLIEHFAAPLPIAVISHMLGVPEEETGAFATYGKLVAALTADTPDAELERANQHLLELFTRLIEQRRVEPRDDVISSLVAVEEEHRLTPDELLGLAGQLLFAGFETTVNMIGNGVKALLDHPDQWALLKENPDLAPDVVEEVLRYESPVRLTWRIAKEDFGPIKTDEQVYVFIGAANRDPEIYPEPGRFDITRERKPEHIALGSGIHYCVGATLARLEGDVVFRTLAERFPGLRITGPVERLHSVAFHGYAKIPVSLS